MGLETGSFIANLITTYPTVGDPVSQGDDHIRLIKSVLQATFPGSGGGFSSAITATEAELNLLSGITGIGNMPAGTNMPFYQASPPVGWTATAIQNDSMMRVVTAGLTGGTSGNATPGHSPILNNVVPSHTHGVNINTGGESANHNHADSGHAHAYTAPGATVTATFYSGGVAVNCAGPAVAAGTAAAAAAIGTESAGHYHNVNGNTAVNGSSANWQPRYMDFCIGTKT